MLHPFYYPLIRLLSLLMPLLLGVFSARTIIFGGLLTHVGLGRLVLAALLMCAVNGPIAQLGLYNLCQMGGYFGLCTLVGCTLLVGCTRLAECRLLAGCRLKWL